MTRTERLYPTPVIPTEGGGKTTERSVSVLSSQRLPLCSGKSHQRGRQSPPRAERSGVRLIAPQKALALLPFSNPRRSLPQFLFFLSSFLFSADRLAWSVSMWLSLLLSNIPPPNKKTNDKHSPYKIIISFEMLLRLRSCRFSFLDLHPFRI